MVRRDPETGKFVSSGNSVTERRRTVTGSLAVNIPAADASGGSQQQQWTGENGEILDFTDVIDSDEIFQLQGLYADISLYQGVTATAESGGVVGYTVAKDLFDPQPLNTRTTALTQLSATDFEEGIVDGAKSQVEDDSVLFSGALYGEASALDTANNLHGGASPWNQERKFLPWMEMGRTIPFDADDELVCVGEMNIDNVSDHGTTFQIDVNAHGFIEEI